MLVYHGSFKLGKAVADSILKNPIVNNAKHGAGFWVTPDKSHAALFGNRVYVYDFPEALLKDCIHYEQQGTDTYGVTEELLSKLNPIGITTQNTFWLTDEIEDGFILMDESAVYDKDAVNININIDSDPKLAQHFIETWIMSDVLELCGLIEDNPNGSLFGVPVNIFITHKVRAYIRNVLYPSVSRQTNAMIARL